MRKGRADLILWPRLTSAMCFVYAFIARGTVGTGSQNVPFKERRHSSPSFTYLWSSQGEAKKFD